MLNGNESIDHPCINDGDNLWKKKDSEKILLDFDDIHNNEQLACVSQSKNLNCVHLSPYSIVIANSKIH